MESIPPRPLAMDAGIAPVPILSVPRFQIKTLGAIGIAFLDFWLNQGLSRMEKASRLFGLVFGRIIF